MSSSMTSRYSFFAIGLRLASRVLRLREPTNDSQDRDGRVSLRARSQEAEATRMVLVGYPELRRRWCNSVETTGLTGRDAARGHSGKRLHAPLLRDRQQPVALSVTARNVCNQPRRKNELVNSQLDHGHRKAHVLVSLAGPRGPRLASWGMGSEWPFPTRANLG